MRVSDLRRKNLDNRSSRAPVEKGGGLVRTLFSRRLTHEEEQIDQLPQQLQAFKESIDQAGDLLDQEPTIANFRAFRDLVAGMTKRVLEMAYRIEKVGGTAIDPRYHEMVALIDREADSLYRLMLQQQKNHLAITKKIMEIKGLVIDLLS